jgi:hypothetical protein
MLVEMSRDVKEFTNSGNVLSESKKITWIRW